MKRIAIYTRVSTFDQRTESQLRELENFVHARQLGEITFYEDVGISGTSTNRPALQKMLRDVRERRIDLVLCWRLDRLFRSLRDVVTTLQEFSELGVEFISFKDNLDLTTASGRLLMHLVAAFGEFEAALIRERVRAGISNARAKGKVLGRPRKSCDPRILSLRSSGRTIKEIEKELGMSRATIYRALSQKGLSNAS